jgi:hypothetical protein
MNVWISLNSSMRAIMKLLLAILITISARADILAVPHPSCAFDAKHTVIWTPLFQAAWDSLNAAHPGEGKAVVNPPNKVMDMLDAFAWKAEDVLLKGSWFVHSGSMNAELYEKANQEAQQRWGTKPFHFAPPPLTDGYAALAMLSRQVSYVTPFERATYETLPFRVGETTQKVKFFGSVNAVDLTGVRVIHYSSALGSFALEARCKDADERVIFYLPAKSSTFAEACQTVNKWKKREVYEQEDGSLLQDRLQSNEEIRIPYVTLHSTANFEPLLQGARTFPNLNVPYFIRKAQQTVYLQLDEKGATVTASAEASTDPFGDAPDSDPRVFDFDQPFFVFLWREKAEWPYLAVWLGDASALQLSEE